MIHLPLKTSEHKAFMRALRGAYRSRTKVQILDREEEVLHNITDRVSSGTVNVDRGQAVDRSLDLELSDLDRAFGFASDSPAEYSLSADKMLRVIRGIFVSELERWVDVPVFTGPPTVHSRKGSVVNVTALGKESLLLEPAKAWRPMHIPKGRKVTDAIREILRAGGERHFDIPDMKVKLRKPVSIGRSSELWKVAKRLAASVDRQLFYDARGWVRMRPLPPHPVFTFKTGAEGTIRDLPSISFNRDRIRNVVEALGPEPEGQQDRLRYVAYPPKGNRLSPWSMGRNGEPLFLPETITMEHATRLEQLKRPAEHKLDDLLRADIEISFNALPILQLEPGDLVSVNVDGEVMRVRAESMSWPVIRGEMSFSNTRRVGRRKKRGGGK